MDNDRRLPQQWPEIENNYYRTPHTWLSVLAFHLEGNGSQSVCDCQLVWKGSGQAAKRPGCLTNHRAFTPQMPNKCYDVGAKQRLQFKKKCHFWYLLEAKSHNVPFSSQVFCYLFMLCQISICSLVKDIKICLQQLIRKQRDPMG